MESRINLGQEFEDGILWTDKNYKYLTKRKKIISLKNEKLKIFKNLNRYTNLYK